jgi:late competence protein required for DNA uptake (superfamily II DNA/RNA helicase)
LYDLLLLNEYPNSNSNGLNHTFKQKHLWVKKITGFGVTEFFLGLIVWLCLRNNDSRNSQMCIVTGPNIDIAIKLIKRMKGLFDYAGLHFSTIDDCLEDSSKQVKF